MGTLPLHHAGATAGGGAGALRVHSSGHHSPSGEGGGAEDEATKRAMAGTAVGSMELAAHERSINPELEERAVMQASSF